MKAKLLLPIVLILGSNVNAQHYHLKFMIGTIFVYSHLSLSGEYLINKKHSVGLQSYLNLRINPMTYYTTTHEMTGLRLNYRYYFANIKKYSFYGQAEGVYTHLNYGDISRKYLAEDYGGGILIGLRRLFGEGKTWFLDLGIGVNGLQRHYISVKTNWDILCETTDHTGHTHIPPRLKDDEFIFVPRLLFEIGFKF